MHTLHAKFLGNFCAQLLPTLTERWIAIFPNHHTRYARCLFSAWSGRYHPVLKARVATTIVKRYDIFSHW